MLVKSAHGGDEYVRVDWGPFFASQLEAASSTFGEPRLVVGLCPLGLSYILRVGGMGYFRKAVAGPFIESGELEIVADAPQFTYPIYAVYLEASEAREEIQQALTAVKAVTNRHGLGPLKPHFF